MALPHITAIGNLVSDPDLRFISSGTAVLEFRLGCNERKRDDNGNWIDGRSTFLTVTLWRQAAEQAAEELQKGMEVVVTGRLVVEEYEKDGQTRQALKIDAESVGRAYGRRKDTSTTRQAQPAQKSAWDDEEPF